MEPQDQHTMLKAKDYPTGVEEWYCPICGRRFIMQWPPAYKRIVLEEGDEQASHNGSTGDIELRISSFQASENQPDGFDEDKLDPWLEYLEDMDIDNKLDSPDNENTV